MCARLDALLNALTANDCHKKHNNEANCKSIEKKCNLRSSDRYDYTCDE